MVQDHCEEPLQTKLEDPMANALLEGRIKRGETVRIQLRQKEICFTPVSEEKKAK